VESFTFTLRLHRSIGEDIFALFAPVGSNGRQEINENCARLPELHNFSFTQVHPPNGVVKKVQVLLGIALSNNVTSIK